LHQGSGSVDPHIFADLDLGSENLADPTNPDPKHWFGGNELEVFISLTDIKYELRYLCTKVWYWFHSNKIFLMFIEKVYLEEKAHLK